MSAAIAIDSDVALRGGQLAQDQLVNEAQRSPGSVLPGSWSVFGTATVIEERVVSLLCLPGGVAPKPHPDMRQSGGLFNRKKPPGFSRMDLHKLRNR